MKMTRFVLLLAVLTGVFMPAAVYADDDKKPPIVIKSGNTKYIISSDSEKFREMLLRADRIKIKTKPKDDDWEKDYYRNYYKHHKDVGEYKSRSERERERKKASYYSGHAVGHVLKD